MIIKKQAPVFFRKTNARPLLLYYKSSEKLRSFQVSNDITFVDNRTLCSTYFHYSSGEIGHYLFVFSPWSGNITEHFVMLVFTTDKRSCRRTFHRYFPQYLSFFGRNNRVGLGALILFDFFFIKILL